MNVIANTAPGRLEWTQRPMPQPGAGQVRIRTAAVGICSTDLQMIDGWERTGFPSIPGHEWAGVVDAVGPQGRAELVGRRCVGDNVLGDGGEVGFEHPGGYGEYFLTEQANIRPVPESISASAAVLIEPLAVCVRGWKRLDREARGPMLIVGDGPVGLLMLMVARHFGAGPVTLLGGLPPRLALAGELGASRAVNYQSSGQTFGRESTGEFDTIVEASGSVTGMETSLRLIARGGRVLVLGDYGPGRTAFSWNDLLHREMSLIGSCTGAGAWDEAVALAADARLPLQRLITHRLPAAQFARGIELTRQKADGMVKVALEWERSGAQ